uniref:Uncharacterized protein n=1 Tax=Psilocybe cubensis TaxID=181762 RepID=A0A8H7XMB3_PSICU
MSLRTASQTVTIADVCVAVVCISLPLSLYIYKSKSKSTSSAGGQTLDANTDAFQVGTGSTGPHDVGVQGYILHNQVTHARLLPKEAAIAFTYPTISLLVSLNALEKRALDLGGGWVFGYGGVWGRVVGLRPKMYLRREREGQVQGARKRGTRMPTTIKKKLLDHLLYTGHLDGGERILQDAWMMTMPSFCGFEGINPLTIHNTFGESHVHVLEVGFKEDENVARGYDHQWTFPREFHVSPFNDRSGFYRVSVKRPTHSPMATDTTSDPPRPCVRVHLYTASEDDPSKPGVLKLTALLRPSHSTPLTTPSLLLSLAKAPLELLLTTPRILFIAWKLHYKKRLDVFLRPEPHPATWTPYSEPSGGVRWLDEGLLEKYARGRVESFLRARVRDIGVEVTIVAPDPNVPPLEFAPDRGAASDGARQKLVVSYLSPRMFLLLCLCPSAEHALLLGCETEKVFRVSSKEVFVRVFEPARARLGAAGLLQRLRCLGIPVSLGIVVPPRHFIEENSGTLDRVKDGMMILTSRFLDWVEKWVFTLARARIVKGQEPWKQWDRAAMIHLNGHAAARSSVTFGSVLSR